LSYIGAKPTIGNFQICDAISVVNGQAAYTMQVGSTNVIPQSANHMIVSLNGVIQKPNSSYTVSGATITFSSNLATGDVINFIQILGDVLDLGVPSDATVTNAKTNFVSTSSAAGLQIKGDGTTDGTLQLNCSQNSHGIKLKSPPHSASASYTLTFPNNDGNANQVLTTDGSGVLSFADASAGITGADFWRLNTDVQFGTGTQIIDSNWSRVDSDSYGVIGSAMTESSGHFTFPTTGIWLIQYYVSLTCTGGEVERFDNRIAMTTNNSSYDDAAFSHLSTDTTNYRQSTSLSFIFDCVNTSTHKIRFNYNDVNNTNSTLIGASNATCTGASFIRLGDT